VYFLHILDSKGLISKVLIQKEMCQQSPGRNEMK